MSTKQRPVLKLPAIREQASSRHGSTRDVLTARDEHPSTHSPSMRKVLLTNLHKQRTVDLGACDGVLCAWAMIRAVLTPRDLCRQNLGRQPWCCSPSRFVHPPPYYRQRRQGAGGAVCGDVDRGRATPSVPQHGVLGRNDAAYFTFVVPAASAAAGNDIVIELAPDADGADPDVYAALWSNRAWVAWLGGLAVSKAT